MSEDSIMRWIARKTGIFYLLKKYSFSLAQAGQDYWVYAEAFDGKRGGYFVDVGAFDGLYLSNSYLLESRYEWSGVCIEGSPSIFESLVKTWRAQCVMACVSDSEKMVEYAHADSYGGIVDTLSHAVGNVPKVILPTRTLVSILKECKSPSEIDYLSVDVEGHEDHVLVPEVFDLYVFRVLTVERPSEHLRSLLQSKGYRLMREIVGLDSFYVHESFLPDYSKNLFSNYSKRYFRLRW